jgi:uncharacterized membrane protein
MSMLAACHFDTDDGAERACRALRDAPTGTHARIHDGALVSWVLGNSQPTTRSMPDLSREGALGDSFWGVLFGLIFFSPLLGAAVGKVTGGLSGSLEELGIHDTFVNRVRDTVTPGTSALFLLGSDTVVEEVHDALRRQPPVKVLTTRLTRQQEDSLHEVFVG